jgi:carbon-monoxide dehydrogenase small subunit
MSEHDIELRVNGRSVRKRVPARRTLLDFLRSDLGLTGTHAGCEHGVCGACTVIIDGVAARSCLALAVQAEGCDIRTIESIAAEDGEFSPVQQAMHDNHGLQCGFCTPGIVMTLTAMSEERADKAAMRDAMSGHICRCTGYQGILKAIDQICEDANHG